MLNVPDEIKELLHLDSCQKNIRIHFPNMERSDICNDLIVMDSVSFTESLCSQNTLKFGLCEYPVFECEVVGVGNITGARIEVFCEIYCDATVEDAIWQADLMTYVYQIPYGAFVVQSAKRQADMIHRKIVAYGGTSLLTNVDPTIEIKTAVPRYNNTADYVFNIFATSVVNAAITKRLEDATYTEQTLSGGGPYISDYHYISRQDSNNYISAQFKVSVKRVSFANEPVDRLYYAERDAIYKTQQDALDELKQSIKDDSWAWWIFDSQVDNLFDWFINSAKYDDYTEKIVGISSSTSSLYKMANGAYIYPYSWKIDPSADAYVMVPYSIGVVLNRRTTYGGLETKTYNVQYTDDTKIKIYEVDISNYPAYTMTYPRVLSKVDANNNKYYKVGEDIDYYKLTKAMAELSGEFYNLTRSDTVRLINIKQQFNLLPDNDLYPDTDLYPESVTGGKLLPEDYQSCWYDDYYTKPYGAISCVYTNTDNAPCNYIYYLTGYDDTSDINSYQTYEISSNAIIDGSKWTEAQIEAICETIAANIEGVTYMPVEFVGRGLPYVEAGDTFEILTASNDSITTIVLNRTISGEQVLTDSYKSV